MTPYLQEIKITNWAGLVSSPALGISASHYVDRGAWHIVCMDGLVMTTYLVGAVPYGASQVTIAWQVYEFCTGEMPFDPHQRDMAHMFAIAAVANADRETSLVPTEIGDGGAAKGLWQWRRARRAAIKLKTGIDVWDQTVASALAGMKCEMGEGGEYHRVFLNIIDCRTPEDASEAWCRYYESAATTHAISRSRLLATAWAKFFAKAAPSEDMSFACQSIG